LNEPGSALGDYLPKAELVRVGLRAVDFARLTNASSPAVITAVRTGVLDAGVANWEDLDNARKLGAQLKILKELRCPKHAWLATKKLDRKTADTIRRHLQPERKHEQDNADFGQGVDALFARNQRKRWRVRANDEAGQNVAKHDGLLETMKEECHHSCDNQDNR
jgi:hypothetical protein